MQSTTILIIDDDAAVRYFLKDMLVHKEQQKEQQILTAESGQKALDMTANQEFDLIFLDLRMKDIGGMEVLAELHKRWPDTPVIVLTAHASLETAVKAVRYGAYDYLFKPCGTDELRKCVHKALRARQRHVRQREILGRLSQTLNDFQTLDAGPVARPDTESGLDLDTGEDVCLLQWDELLINLTRHIATLNGQLLDLSPTQFDMLVYLVSEAPRVISPKELVLAVHEYESEPHVEEARNIARSHIYQIRKRIAEIGGSKDLIRTMRGVGYRMKDLP